jgi:hypothetical protein
MAKNKIQISWLGKEGRFGNQLFQYAFARSYAQKYNCDLEIPKDWDGRKFFPEVKEDEISSPLPPTEVDTFEHGVTNVDIRGYFQNTKSLSLMNREQVRSWFKFSDDILSKFKKPREYYVAIHMRLGDYRTNPNVCIPSQSSYLNFAKSIGVDENDIIWVTEETQTEGDDGTLGFLYDFMLMVNSDILIRSPSTFSWWAGELKNDDNVYAPDVSKYKGQKGINVPFVRGNWPTCTELDATRTNLHWS